MDCIVVDTCWSRHRLATPSSKCSVVVCCPFWFVIVVLDTVDSFRVCSWWSQDTSNNIQSGCPSHMSSGIVWISLNSLGWGTATALLATAEIVSKRGFFECIDIAVACQYCGCQQGTRPLWFQYVTKGDKIDAMDKTYHDGGVPPTVITETQMAVPWDYSKEENQPLPSINPTEDRLNPARVSTWQQLKAG